MKFRARLHRAAEGRRPFVAHQNARTLLFRPDECMAGNAAAVGPERTAGFLGWVGEQREADIIRLRIGTGGDGAAMPGKRPRNTSVRAADIFCAVAPAVSVIADAGDHGECDFCGTQQLHAHFRNGRVGPALPVPDAVLQLREGIGAVCLRDDFRNGLAVGKKAEYVCSGASAESCIHSVHSPLICV